MTTCSQPPMTMMFMLVMLPLAAYSFVVLPSRPALFRGGRLLDSEGPIEFSDFGDDFWAGDASAAAKAPGGLQELVDDLQHEKDTQLTENWQQGNWQVRGFSLDRYSAAKEDGESTSISKIAMMGVSDGGVVVGRTDGSVCLVELGTEYWTKFESKLKAIETSNVTVSVESQLVRNDEEKRSVNEIPFEVVHQFMAHEGKEISALLLAEDEHDETIVVTADVTGHMTVWSIPDVEGERVFPLRNLEAHSDRVVALKQVSLSGNTLLFSASVDGSLAFWDMWTGDLVYRCQMMEEENNGEAIRILSVDATDDKVYLGLESGHVVAYLVSEMVQAASIGGSCPIPNGRFLAHPSNGGVTAIACDDSSSSSNNSLITGDASGVVKQWEIISRLSSVDEKTTLEHWPRLSNQRMKERAHIFQGHSERITALQYHPNAILSASVDGTVRAWNIKTGKELFVMDGFSADINSLCLSENTLVTNGMNQFVCVHDFGIDALTEVDDGLELDW